MAFPDTANLLGTETAVKKAIIFFMFNANGTSGQTAKGNMPLRVRRPDQTSPSLSRLTPSKLIPKYLSHFDKKVWYKSDQSCMLLEPSGLLQTRHGSPIMLCADVCLRAVFYDDISQPTTHHYTAESRRSSPKHIDSLCDIIVISATTLSVVRSPLENQLTDV